MTEVNTATLPPKVAAALAAVMSEVPKLSKSERNSHGSYNFASIDDFLEAVRPLCAKHGLIIVQDEESFETIQAGKDRNGNDRTWLLIRFSYTLAHASGETWGHKPTRSIMVDASMGSQAFGAAQSYSLKQFERSLFQIATGEKDADADTHPPADLPVARSVSVSRGVSKAKEKANGSPSARFVHTAVSEISGIQTLDRLKAWWEANASHIAALSEEDRGAVEKAKDDRKAALGTAEAA